MSAPYAVPTIPAPGAECECLAWDGIWHRGVVTGHGLVGFLVRISGEDKDTYIRNDGVFRRPKEGQ